MNYLTKLTFLSLTICLFANIASAEDSYLDIGNGRRFVCIVTPNEGNYLGRFFNGEGWYEVGFNRYLSRTERRLGRLKIKLTRAQNRGVSNSRIARLRRRITATTIILNDMYDCWFEEGKYSSGSGNLPDNGDDNENTPTPPSTSPTLACDVSGGNSNTRSISAPISRIINGNVCSVGNSPVVELIMFQNGREDGGCTGTVVGKRVVITAAHCLEGGVDRVDIVTGLGRYTAVGIFAHPNFDRNPNLPLEANDVAVLTFSEDLPTRTVSILASNDIQSGEIGVIAGYGLDENGRAGTLRAAPVNIARKTQNAITIEYSGRGDNGNTCSGDSGGPIFIKRGSNWILAGVTSNGVRNNCGAGDVSNFANITDPSNVSFFNGIF